MNWDHLRYLMAIADQGSVSRGAQLLGVSHATALRAVKRMELDLGARLFDHLRTGYKLTPAGEAVLEKSRIIEKLVETIEREQKGRDQEPAGELRIAIPDTSLCNLMPLLNTFTSQHTQIRLCLVSTTFILPEDLLAKQLDAVISVTNEPPEDLVGRQIKRLDFVPVIRRDTVPGDNKDQALNWICWSGGSSNRESDEMQQKMMRRLRNSRVIMRTSSHEEALQAVRAGIGIACLSRSVLESDKENLVAWSPPQGAASHKMGLWVLTHPDLRSSGRVTAFLRFFSDLK